MSLICEIFRSCSWNGLTPCYKQLISVWNYKYIFFNKKIFSKAINQTTVSLVKGGIARLSWHGGCKSIRILLVLSPGLCELESGLDLKQDKHCVLWKRKVFFLHWFLLPMWNLIGNKFYNKLPGRRQCVVLWILERRSRTLLAFHMLGRQGLKEWIKCGGEKSTAAL